jgi:two-component system LytT family response regulator
MNYKTILIDDEPLAVSRLKRLLSNFEDVFDILDTAANGEEGIEKIEELKPDLIFLDIEMPLLNGFEMLEQLNYMPKVIFCTAYDQYAVQAFEENSLDYLLKPVEKERLEKTVEKLRSFEKTESGMNTDALAKLLTQVNQKKTIHSITVKKGDKILFIPLTDIAYFHAEDKYVFLNSNDGKQYLTSYTISLLDEKLPEEFIRISRSAIIHSHRIASLEKAFNGKYVVNLNDIKKTKLESGTSYGDNLKRLMEV